MDFKSREIKVLILILCVAGAFIIAGNMMIQSAYRDEEGTINVSSSLSVFKGEEEIDGGTLLQGDSIDIVYSPTSIVDYSEGPTYYLIEVESSDFILEGSLTENEEGVYSATIDLPSSTEGLKECYLEVRMVDSSDQVYAGSVDLLIQDPDFSWEDPKVIKEENDKISYLDQDVPLEWVFYYEGMGDLRVELDGEVVAEYDYLGYKENNTLKYIYNSSELGTHYIRVYIYDGENKMNIDSVEVKVVSEDYGVSPPGESDDGDGFLSAFLGFLISPIGIAAIVGIVVVFGFLLYYFVIKKKKSKSRQMNTYRRF